jgi:hypothetical protein
VRATRLLYAFAILEAMVLSGCSGGSGSGGPGPIGVSVTVSPVTASVQVGLTQMVTATVANDSANKGVTWALSGAGCSAATCGTLSAANSASGTAIAYTAPTTVPSPANVTLTATSVADGTKTAAVTMTVTAGAPAIAVTLSKPTANLQVGTSTTFSATVANDSGNKGVSWALSGAGCGGVTCGTVTPSTSPSGIAVSYVAPASVPTPPTVLLTATSVADGTKSAAATITITAATSTAITITLSQSTASVVTGGTQTFAATVANDSANQGVTWALSGTGCTGATCGTVTPTASASGTAVTYTAPVSVPVPPTVTLTATSVADTTKTAAATITVTVSAGISVTLTPKRGGLTLGQPLSFTATVTNDVGAAGVMWSATTGTFSAQTSTTATYVAGNSPGSVTVTATSIADGTQTASATIGVTDLAGVTTYHNDLSRDGANVQEYALKTSNVATATFGKLFSCPVVGAVYSQPLWVPNVTIGSGGGTHNVIVVATQRDWVYVFDADAGPCTMYWSTQFIPSGETYVNYDDFTTGGVSTEDIYQDIGITGTPVIDPSTNTIYLVTKTKNTGTLSAHSRLHALSLTTGTEATNSPVEISASVAGNCDGGSSVAFNPLMQNQRPGLALLNGVVYVGWGSHGDVGNWHGWLMGFQTANLTAAPSVFLSTPNGLASPVSGAPPCAGGIWMSGGAPAIDENNNLFVLTGNGAWDGASDFGDSYLRLSTPALSRMDYFTPSNQSTLDSNDTDVGSSGTAVLIDQTNGPVQHLLVGASKGSVFFVLNRDSMSGFNSGGDRVVQEFGLDGHSFSTPGFWNNDAYFFGVNFGGTLAGETFAFNTGTGQFNSTATHHTPSTFGFPGATPSISASSATTDGIVWAINAASYGTSDSGSRAAAPAVLHAFDASNVSTELWNSSQASGGRDTAGFAVKFTVPTVANGKVYMGTRGSDDTLGNGSTTGELDVYGLLPN